MTRAQILAVGFCIAVNTIDGFDIMCASFTGPGIAHAWSLSPAALGLVFSAAPAGMVIGAIALSPLADLYGRRRMIPLYLLLVTVGMAAAGLAPNLPTLLCARLAAGVGVAATMATINTVVAEQANGRWRDLCVCLQAGGFPLGGTVGALTFLALTGLGWRFVFFVGALLSAVLGAAALALVPQSVQVRRAPRSAPGASPEAPRTVAPASPEPRGRAWSGLGPGPLLICLSFFTLMFTFYFLTSWTPKLLTDYGLSVKLGVSGAVFINLGGLVGDLVFAGLAGRWPASKLGPLFMVSCFVTTAVFAFAPLALSALLPLAFLLGFLLYASMACLYAVVPAVFPGVIRTTGTGVALGLGRIGATVGPYVGGLMIAGGWTRAHYLLAMAAPLLACAAMTLALARRAPSSLETLALAGESPA